jgi:hypothetical protein
MSKITFDLPADYPVPAWHKWAPAELGQLFDNITEILELAPALDSTALDIVPSAKINELSAELAAARLASMREVEQLSARLKLKDDLLQQLSADIERIHRVKDEEHKKELDKLKMQSEQVRAEIEQRSNAQLSAQLDYSRRDIDRMHAQFERMHQELERKYNDQLTIQCANVRQDAAHAKQAAEHAKQDMQQMRQDMQRMRQLTDEQSGQGAAAKETNELIGRLAEQLNDTVAPIARFFGGTNAEKGMSGEHIIYNILTTHDKYTDAVVEDVHGQAAHGDLIMKWKKLNCMFEIKNKQTLTNGDLDKFERDIRYLIQTRQINSGIFISLQTAVFPGKTRELIQIELIDRVPVLYIYLSNINDMHYSIACLERLVSIGTTENEQVQRLTVHFNKYHEYLSNSQKYLNRVLLDYKQMMRRTQEQLSMTDKLYEQVSEDFKEFPTRASPSAMVPEPDLLETKGKFSTFYTWPTDTDERQDKINALITDHLLHCETPVSHANLQIPAQVVTEQELKSATEKIKNTLIKQIVDPIHKQLVEYKSKVKRNLTRQELVGKDLLFSESTFRRLSNILKLGRGTMAWVNRLADQN